MRRYRLIFLTFPLLLAVLLSSCFFQHDSKYDLVTEGVTPFKRIGYSTYYNKAFVGSYLWDGTEEGKRIIIPEHYNGMPVTSLGGTSGSGYPVDFSIEINDAAVTALFPNATSWYTKYYFNDTPSFEADKMRYVTFELHLNKHIENLEKYSLGGYNAYYEVHDENENILCAYVFSFYFTCDEQNETFYTEDGKLYYRNTDTLVESIRYADPPTE